MDDGCIGYLRLVSCYHEFPACIDNGKTFSVSPICDDVCSKYKIRCGDVRYIYIIYLMF